MLVQNSSGLGFTFPAAPAGAGSWLDWAKDNQGFLMLAALGLLAAGLLKGRG